MLLDATTTTMTLNTLVENISALFTGIMGWLTELVTTISGQPLLLLYVGIVPLCGIAVGFFGRIMHSH